MTRLGWIASLSGALGLALGVALGWGLARAVPAGPGRLLAVSRIPPYEPVEIVPDSAGWPAGRPVAVATVEPPTRKEASKIEEDFNLWLVDSNILGKFNLPDMPDGGKAVVSVAKRDNNDKPEPVTLTVKVSKPPLLRIRWEPRFEGWYGYAAEPGWSGQSWSAYLGLADLVCVRDRVCVQARAGRESRPWGEGWLAEAGVSITF